MAFCWRVLTEQRWSRFNVLSYWGLGRYMVSWDFSTSSCTHDQSDRHESTRTSNRLYGGYQLTSSFHDYLVVDILPSMKVDSVLGIQRLDQRSLVYGEEGAKPRPRPCLPLPATRGSPYVFASSSHSCLESIGRESKRGPTQQMSIWINSTKD